MSADSEIRPFRIDIAQRDLDYLSGRLARPISSRCSRPTTSAFFRGLR
jgi:hypothetical protein